MWFCKLYVLSYYIYFINYVITSFILFYDQAIKPQPFVFQNRCLSPLTIFYSLSPPPHPSTIQNSCRPSIICHLTSMFSRLFLTFCSMSSTFVLDLTCIVFVYLSNLPIMFHTILKYFQLIFPINFLFYAEWENKFHHMTDLHSLFGSCFNAKTLSHHWI